MDPYAPPRSHGDGDYLSNKSALKEVVSAWEKLRLIYNGLLLIPGILIEAIMVVRQDMPIEVAVIGAVLVGTGANVAYFLGPLAELYFRALFRNGESIGRGRLLIFGAGLVISAGVFLLALFGALA